MNNIKAPHPIYFLTMRRTKGQDRASLTAIKDESTGERFACVFVSFRDAEEFMVANDLTCDTWKISQAHSPDFVQGHCYEALHEDIYEAVINPPPVIRGVWRILPTQHSSSPGARRRTNPCWFGLATRSRLCHPRKQGSKPEKGRAAKVTSSLLDKEHGCQARRRLLAALGVAPMLLLAGCSSGKEARGETASEESATVAAAEPTGGAIGGSSEAAWPVDEVAAEVEPSVVQVNVQAVQMTPF
ncbi:MAG: hypothetical protein M3246_07535, partial [Actinomycetota bacterium]|nr:hypothetical protein [Actinomycetota bacterium]